MRKNIYQCELCEKSFTFPSALAAHVHAQHFEHHTQEITDEQNPACEMEDEMHECQICFCRFKSKVLLANHMNCHGERKYLCDDCGKQFKTRLALKLHIRIHTGEKPHKCDICEKMFAQASSLAYHKRVHTGQKIYVINLL